MRTLPQLFCLWALLFSPMLNAEDITGNHDVDKQRIVNITRTLDARAKHCHRMINYLGGFNAASELYNILQGEDTGHKMLLGSCVEFVQLTGVLTDVLSAMEQRYGARPKPPTVDQRAHIMALMLYLESIEQQQAFIATFSE